MLLGLHTYSFYLHGIGQAWADFKLPWPRQMSTFELFEEAVRMGLDGLHLDDGVLETLDPAYLREVKAAAREHGLYLEYNFSMDLGGMGIGIQHDLNEAIATAEYLGADIVKVSMDLARPRPLAGSRFHPRVKEQMKSFAARLKAAAPAAAEPVRRPQHLEEQGGRIGAASDERRRRPVVERERVAVDEVIEHPGHDALLADAEVHLPGDATLLPQVGEDFLEAPHAEHLPIEPDQGYVLHRR